MFLKSFGAIYLFQVHVQAVLYFCTTMIEGTLTSGNSATWNFKAVPMDSRPHTKFCLKNC